LGEEIAIYCDIAILIDKRADDILRGLKENFSGSIYRFDTLQDAQKEFGNILHIGDNVLLLNDLPDIYED
ncbi:MAG: UDP-N-acetylmuramoyl-tripeptide--D-alanyl-D-alanine ligase, partial [Clostridia bacterium]|nr:UDP-N-acetylmuramoyl-tripeptide--D-alanyl-D-alanine ligase [Clostridia bacterium]